MQVGCTPGSIVFVCSVNVCEGVSDCRELNSVICARILCPIKEIIKHLFRLLIQKRSVMPTIWPPFLNCDSL